VPMLFGVAILLTATSPSIPSEQEMHNSLCISSSK